MAESRSELKQSHFRKGCTFNYYLSYVLTALTIKTASRKAQCNDLGSLGDNILKSEFVFPFALSFAW